MDFTLFFRQNPDLLYIRYPDRMKKAVSALGTYSS